MLLNSEILNTVRKRIDDSKQIPNYSNYVILPNEGLVYSLKQRKFIGAKNSCGYYNCSLYNDKGMVWNSKLHRVIYTACYGEIPNNMDVNHIDENKNNNNILNLNLLTHKENINWGTHNVRMAKAQINNPKKSKPVGAYKDGVLVMTFPSASEAGRNGFYDSPVGECCKGKRKTYKGYQWRYIETEKVSI